MPNENRLRKKGFMVLRASFVAFVSYAAVGCGQSAVQGSGQAGKGSPSVGMKEKLNAMSVPDRLAYIKQHPEAIRTISGGSAPMRRASPTAGAQTPAAAP